MVRIGSQGLFAGGRFAGLLAGANLAALSLAPKAS